MTHPYTPLTEHTIRNATSVTSAPELPVPLDPPVLVDIFSDEPLVCPYQHPSLHGDETCEACQ